MAKIMLVEDDNNLREIYGARLLAEGHTIVAAKDGEEALALAVKEKPDLIISDVMMPRISGFDMLDILRNAPETKNTKVIMMTALSQAEDKARADKLGADRYLVKSQVTLEDVAKAVKDVLQDNSGDAPITGVDGATTVDPTTEPATPQAAATTEQVNPTNPVVATPENTTPEQDEAQAVAEPKTKEAVGAEPTTTPVELDPPVGTAPNIETPPAQPVSAEETQSIAAAAPAAPATPTPAPPVEAAEPAIKVELPTPPSEQTTTPPDAPTATEDPKPVSVVGPSLAEALQQEEVAEAKATNTEEEPKQATPNPSIINGAESLGVVSPTQPPPTVKEEGPTPPTQAEPHKPENPLDDSPKKKVIEPINDLTKTPDLKAMAEAEAGVGNVVDPATQTVVEPSNTPPPEAPVDDHSKIAL
jgi:DNA-binding response OmpR family regulator